MLFLQKHHPTIQETFRSVVIFQLNNITSYTTAAVASLSLVNYFHQMTVIVTSMSHFHDANPKDNIHPLIKFVQFIEVMDCVQKEFKSKYQGPSAIDSSACVTCDYNISSC